MNAGHKDNGTYIINPTLISGRHFSVYCMFQRDKQAAWTVIQRRENGEVDFNRNWVQYENGFGTLNGSFWLGLWKIYDLTSGRGMVARFHIGLTLHMNEIVFAEYEEFAIGNSSESYAFHIAKYNTESTISDRFTSGWCNLQGMIFTIAITYGDNKPLHVGWWCGNCCPVILNRIYPPSNMPEDDCALRRSWKKYIGLVNDSDGCYKLITFSEMRIGTVKRPNPIY